MLPRHGGHFPEPESRHDSSSFERGELQGVETNFPHHESRTPSNATRPQAGRAATFLTLKRQLANSPTTSSTLCEELLSQPPVGLEQHQRFTTRRASASTTSLRYCTSADLWTGARALKALHHGSMRATRNQGARRRPAELRCIPSPPPRPTPLPHARLVTPERPSVHPNLQLLGQSVLVEELGPHACVEQIARVSNAPLSSSSARTIVHHVKIVAVSTLNFSNAHAPVRADAPTPDTAATAAVAIGTARSSFAR